MIDVSPKPVGARSSTSPTSKSRLVVLVPHLDLRLRLQATHLVTRALRPGLTSAMATAIADGAGLQTIQHSGAHQTLSADASDRIVVIN